MTLDILTPVELTTARLILAGHSTKEIAAEMGNTTQVVKNRLHSIYAKLGITGRVQLAVVMWQETEGKT